MGIIVWWMGVDYELFCATLCTRSVLLVIHSLGYILMIYVGHREQISARRPIYFLNLHHPAYKLMGFGRCAHPRKKKVVLAAFLVVIRQTITYAKFSRT